MSIQSTGQMGGEELPLQLNLAQLKDLEYICALAEAYYPKEQEWIQRIRKYRELFKQEISDHED